MEPTIGGYKSTLNISDIAVSEDGSVTINSDGNISQTTKNSPQRYYSAPIFGKSFGAFAQSTFINNDATFIQTVVMDLTPGDFAPPTISFEANSLNDNVPEVTLYWMTTSPQQETVFATNSATSVNVSVPANSKWYANSYIYSLDFEPQKNYTEITIGGYFNELGASRAGLANSFNMYGVINLSAGLNISKTINGNPVSFGPLGSALSAQSYYGGIGGLRLGSTNSTTNNIRCVKYIDLTASSGNYSWPGAGRQRKYLCIAGDFDTIFYAGSTIKTNNFFIIDRDNPRTHFCRFDLPGATIFDLEYDPDYQSLIIGGLFKTNVVRMLSGLSSNNINQSFINTNSWEASAGPVNGIIRLYLGYRDTQNVNVNCPLWDRFHFDSKFCAQAGLQIVNTTVPINTNAGSTYFHTPFVRHVKYLKDVVYASNCETPVPRQRGVVGFYCGEGRYGPDETPSTYPGGIGIENKAERHKNIGVCVSKLDNTIFSDLYLRWPNALSFNRGGSQSYNHIYHIDTKKTSTGETFLFVGGYFTSYTNENGVLQYYNPTTTARYVAAFNLTDSLSSSEKPKHVSNWIPLPSTIVSHFEPGIEGEADADVVYIAGNFTKITTKEGVYNRTGLAALSMPGDINKPVSVYNWFTNIFPLSTGNGPLQTRRMWNIPNSSPLSGLMVHSWATNKVNNYPVNNLFRVSRYGQNIAPYIPQAVEWKIGSKVLDGTDLALNSTSYLPSSSVAGPEFEIRATTFPPVSFVESEGSGMENLQTGSLMRFAIQRPSRSLAPATSSQFYNGRVWFLGAKIDQSEPL